MNKPNESVVSGCTCQEPHISNKICHHIKGDNCHVIDPFKECNKDTKDSWQIVPSGRIDYCSTCKKEHGYYCPEEELTHNSQNKSKCCGADRWDRTYPVCSECFKPFIQVQSSEIDTFTVDKKQVDSSEDKEYCIHTNEGICDTCISDRAIENYHLRDATKEIPTPEQSTWEEEFDKIVKGRQQSKFHRNYIAIHVIKSFISQKIDENRIEAYTDGQKDAFGVDRKRVFEEGRQEAFKSLLSEVKSMKQATMGNYNVAISKMMELLEGKIK